MYKYLLLIFVLIVSLVPINTSHSQGGWSLYFYNSSSEEIIQFDADGSQSVYTIQKTGKREVIATRPVVKNGKVAFCTDDLSSSTGASSGGQGANPGNNRPTKFYLQDLITGENLVAKGLGTAACHISANPFNADGSQLAFGTLDAVNNKWQLLIVDVLSGNLLHELNTVPGEIMERNRMPSARYLGEDTLSFALLMWFTGGAPINQSYTWNMADNSVVEDAKWGQFNPAYLPATGEMVWTALDESRPGGPLPSNNIVRYLTADGTESVIFYSADMLPISSVFIDNGNALAINLMASVDPSSGLEFSAGSQWIRLDRNGTITVLTELSSGYSLITPIPNGYLVNTYTSTIEGGDQIILSFHSPELTTEIMVEGPLFLAGTAGIELNPGEVQAFTAVP